MPASDRPNRARSPVTRSAVAAARPAGSASPRRRTASKAASRADSPGRGGKLARDRRYAPSPVKAPGSPAAAALSPLAARRARQRAQQVAQARAAQPRVEDLRGDDEVGGGVVE